MIVARDNAFRGALAQILRWDDFEEVSEAASAAEGRRRLATLRGSIDLAVLDLDLPDDGVELVREMREAEPEMPIMVLTVASEREVHERLREMGAIEVLTKGVSGEELLAAIKRFRDR